MAREELRVKYGFIFWVIGLIVFLPLSVCSQGLSIINHELAQIEEKLNNLEVIWSQTDQGGKREAVTEGAVA